MFQITKFVIAAALTAIIAAPVMAQGTCPCWNAIDISMVGVQDSTCSWNLELEEGIIVNVILQGVNLGGYSEEAFVGHEIINGAGFCNRIEYVNGEIREVPGNPGIAHHAKCVELITAECIDRGFVPLE